tara:strand:+ start:1985 stop:2239 length:255 start_codon:yes stop_codon:yes gene_type:complete
MDFNIFVPYGINYYVAEPIYFITFNNISNEYIYGYSLHKKNIFILPPHTKRKYLFLLTMKKIIIKYHKNNYLIKLIENMIYTIP